MADKSNKISQFKIDETYLLTLLEEMIKINSVVGQEEELGNFIQTELNKLGLKTEIDSVDKKRANIYASYNFGKGGKTLTFNGHLDTVDVCENWKIDPFTPVKKENKIFGLGSLDMKSGLACQLSAIKALIETKSINLPGTLHFTAVVDEEGYGKGARKMLKHPVFGKNQTSAIIIAEPFSGLTNENVLPLGMTGKALYKITFHGKASHAFQPEKGVNAINDAARFISSLDMDKNDAFKRMNLPEDQDIGKGSLCVLKIAGGYKKYEVVIPEKCEVILNRLLIPGETKESIIEDLTRFVSRLPLQSNVKIDLIPPFYLPYKISSKSFLINSLKKAFKQIYQKSPKFGYISMITDANTFTGEGNIPCCLIGPTGKNIHSANEYVNIDSLKPLTELYCKFYEIYQK